MILIVGEELLLTTSNFVGFAIPIPILPLESIRSLSLPPVSAEIVSLAGNLIAVFESLS